MRNVISVDSLTAVVQTSSQQYRVGEAIIQVMVDSGVGHLLDDVSRELNF